MRERMPFAESGDEKELKRYWNVSKIETLLLLQLQTSQCNLG